MLIDILRMCAEDSGAQFVVSDQRSYLVNRVNQAAKEVYESTDLVNSLMEQVFCLGDANQQQLVLPWYVFQIRGVRGYTTWEKITANDMRPRYATESWGPDPLWTWRVKYLSPIFREISNASQLTFTIAVAEDADIVLHISGATPTAARVVEEVTIAAGDLTATSTNTYISGRNDVALESIRKEAICDNDISVTDASGNQLALIPNSELEALYQIVQVRNRSCCESEDFALSGCSNCVEILYKRRFTAMVNDYDPFCCGDRYDKAIFYKFMEHWLTNQQGMEQRAIGMRAKCIELVRQIGEDASDGTSKPMDFGRNRFTNVVDYFPWWGGYYGTGAWYR